MQYLLMLKMQSAVVSYSKYARSKYNGRAVISTLGADRQARSIIRRTEFSEAHPENLHIGCTYIWEMMRCVRHSPQLGELRSQ